MISTSVLDNKRFLWYFTDMTDRGVEQSGSSSGP